MKKLTLLVSALIFFSFALTVQMNVSVSVTDDIYEFLDVANKKGLCSPLNSYKPYTRSQILESLQDQSLRRPARKGARASLDLGTDRIDPLLPMHVLEKELKSVGLVDLLVRIGVPIGARPRAKSHGPSAAVEQTFGDRRLQRPAILVAEDRLR